MWSLGQLLDIADSLPCREVHQRRRLPNLVPLRVPDEQGLVLADGALREFLGSLALQESADSLTQWDGRGAPSASALRSPSGGNRSTALVQFAALGRFEDAPAAD